MTWLLCDYGEVLCLPQPPADRAALEQYAGLSGPAFWSAYWDGRPDYDRGTVAAADYWSTVLGTRPDAARLRGLVERDIAGWLAPNLESLAAVAGAAARGLRPAVLSNAPHEVADAVDRLDWMGGFAPRLYSCRLGTIKPEPAVYVAALAKLEASPAEVIFLDDRPVNVAAAIELGMRAQLFTDPAQIDALDGTTPR